jgi:hypothetical protein
MIIGSVVPLQEYGTLMAVGIRTGKVFRFSHQ